MPWPQRSGEMRHSSISVKQNPFTVFFKGVQFFLFKSKLWEIYPCSLPVQFRSSESRANPLSHLHLKLPMVFLHFPWVQRLGTILHSLISKNETVRTYDVITIQKHCIKEQCRLQSSSFLMIMTPPFGKIVDRTTWTDTDFTLTNNIALEPRRALSAIKQYSPLCPGGSDLQLTEVNNKISVDRGSNLQGQRVLPKEPLCLLVSEKKTWLPWVTENITSINKSTCHFSLWIINGLVTVYKTKAKTNNSSCHSHIFSPPFRLQNV